MRVLHLNVKEMTALTFINKYWILPPINLRLSALQHTVYQSYGKRKSLIKAFKGRRISCILALLRVLTFPANENLLSKHIVDRYYDASLTQIQRNEKIRILETHKRCDTNSVFWNRYSLACTKWKLDRSDIIRILSFRKKEDAFEIHNHYNVLPCYYQGFILLNNSKYFFTINAGSFIILSKGKTNLYYSCTNKKIARYFITSKFED
jgi:hypothetical protein